MNTLDWFANRTAWKAGVEVAAGKLSLQIPADTRKLNPGDCHGLSNCNQTGRRS
jgi:hypothetical protein